MADPYKRPSLVVQIVESPSASDIYDGQTEGRVVTEALRLSGINSRYNVVVNRTKFLHALLDFMELRTANPDALPVLHLSMHGSVTGVELTDGTFLSWKWLGKVITVASEGKALLCMSTCFGFSACQMAFAPDTLPFMGIVGHSGEVTWDAAAVAYVTFYHRLVRGDTFTTAVCAMQQATGDERFIGVPATEVQRFYQQIVTEQEVVARRRYLEQLMRKTPNGGDDSKGDDADW